MLNRRSFFMGALAAPLVVKTPGLLMPVRKVAATPLAINRIARVQAPLWAKELTRIVEDEIRIAQLHINDLRSRQLHECAEYRSFLGGAPRPSGEGA